MHFAKQISSEVSGDAVARAAESRREMPRQPTPRGGAIDISFQTRAAAAAAQTHWPPCESESLPRQAQIGIGSLRKSQDLRLLLGREQRYAPRTFDLVLPPADQSVMLRRRCFIEPERILRDRVRGQLAGKPMRAEKLVDGSNATSSGPSPKGVKLRGFMRTYISWSSRKFHRRSIPIVRAQPARSAASRHGHPTAD